MHPLAAALLGTCVLASTASAQVYRWVDERGRVHYGNLPRPGAIRLELREPVAPRLPATAARVRELPAINASAPGEFPGRVDQATVASVGHALSREDCRRRPAQCSPAEWSDASPRALPPLSALRLP
jgi:hypothetical protein